MPIDMTQQELGEQLTTAVELDSYEYGEVGSEDYCSASLYKTDEGKHFRYVHAAGMTALPTAESGEWLEEAEVGNWKDF